MCCECHGVTDAHGGGVEAGTGAEMGVFTHIFQCMGFFGEGIKHSSDLGSFGVPSINGSEDGCFGDF